MGSKGCGTKKYAKGGTKVSVKKVATKTTKPTKKKDTKKYAMGGLSQQCDPGDGSCKTVRKEGVIKRWIRNAKNRNLSNFNKPKFKRTRYK